MVMDAFSGSRLDTSPFDLNGDGEFDSKDYVSLSDGTKVPATAIGQDSIQSSPTVMTSNDTASSGGGSDLLIFNGSDGTPTVMKFNPGPRSVGRQSWRQVR
jgi:type IV pilus assembly protein PilY1